MSSQLNLEKMKRETGEVSHLKNRYLASYWHQNVGVCRGRGLVGVLTQSD
jgi:hypothetical protein